MNDIIQPEITSARPTILIEGQPVDALSEDLLALSIEHRINHPSRCELRLSNYGQTGQGVGFRYFDLQDFNFGQALEVRDNQDEVLFTGQIGRLDALYPADSPPEINLIAEDRLAELDTVHRSRSFDDMKTLDVFEIIADAHSLVVDSQISVPDPMLPVINQINQTDRQLLTQLAAPLGVEFWVENDTLFVIDRSAVPDSRFSLEYGQGLISFQAEANLAKQVSKVSVAGWNPQQKQPIAETVNHQILSDEATGKTAGELITSWLGERDQLLVTHLPMDAQHARSIAEAAYRSQARRFVTGRGVCEGEARLRIGTYLDLDGLGELFEGRYYVAAVTHSFDMTNGYRTAFEVERPVLGTTRIGKPSRPGRSKAAKKPKSMGKPKPGPQKSTAKSTRKKTSTV